MKLAEKVIKLYESKNIDLSKKGLVNIVKAMVKEGIPYNKNAEFASFKDEALKRAKDAGLTRIVPIDVIQALDKALKSKKNESTNSSVGAYFDVGEYKLSGVSEAKRIGKNLIAVTKEEKAIATEMIFKLMDRGVVNIDSDLKHKVAMDLVNGGQAVVTKKKEYGKIAQIRGVD